MDLKIFALGGVKAVIEEYVNQKKIWHLEKFSSTNNSSSSLSDTGAYLEICKLATSDDDIFGIFKRNAQYRAILEHVNYVQGREYLGYISKNNRLIQNLKEIALKDVGDPLSYTYRGLGTVSPTQIRYAKIISDLTQLFKTLDGMVISEIGIGNGGLAAQITNLFNVEKYNLYDLPEVLDLSHKCLKHMNVIHNFDFIDGRNPEPRSSDLLISNYAFSELNREIQEKYLENVILKSPRGFMLYNHIQAPESNYIKAKDLLGIIPNSHLWQELPNTAPGNVLLVWGA